MKAILVLTTTILLISSNLKASDKKGPGEGYSNLLNSVATFFDENKDQLKKSFDLNINVDIKVIPSKGKIQDKKVSYPVFIDFTINYYERGITEKINNNSKKNLGKIEKGHFLYVRMLKESEATPIIITNQVYKSNTDEFGKYKQLLFSALSFLKDNKEKFKIVYKKGEEVTSYTDFPDEPFIDFTKDVKFPITFNITLNGNHVIKMNKKDKNADFKVIEEKIIK